MSRLILSCLFLLSLQIMSNGALIGYVLLSPDKIAPTELKVEDTDQMDQKTPHLQHAYFNPLNYYHGLNTYFLRHILSNGKMRKMRKMNSTD